jgi:hypothetical protein
MKSYHVDDVTGMVPLNRGGCIRQTVFESPYIIIPYRIQR